MLVVPEGDIAAPEIDVRHPLVGRSVDRSDADGGVGDLPDDDVHDPGVLVAVVGHLVEAHHDAVGHGTFVAVLAPVVVED